VVAEGKRGVEIGGFLFSDFAHGCRQRRENIGELFATLGEERVVPGGCIARAITYFAAGVYQIGDV
jgi:hypothetical protein